MRRDLFVSYEIESKSFHCFSYLPRVPKQSYQKLFQNLSYSLREYVSRLRYENSTEFHQEVNSDKRKVFLCGFMDEGNLF